MEWNARNVISNSVLEKQEAHYISGPCYSYLQYEQETTRTHHTIRDYKITVIKNNSKDHEYRNIWEEKTKHAQAKLLDHAQLIKTILTNANQPVEKIINVLGMIFVDMQIGY